MMNEIIRIERREVDGDVPVQTVDARELHEFLEIGKDFSTWIKDRIRQYEFAEGRDYVCSPILGSEGRGGHNRKDYFLTLDMAKELSMVERNEKGKQARQYFIECERRAKRDPVEVLNDPEAMRGLLLSYSEKVLALEAKAAELAPKAEALDRIATADGALCITDAAKALQMRPKDLFSYLQAHGWIYRRPGGGHYLGYQSKVASGLLEHKITTVLKADGNERIVEQVRVTPKGLTRLAALIHPVGQVA